LLQKPELRYRQAWWYISIIPAPRRQWQKAHEFNVRMDYKPRSHVKKKKKHKKNPVFIDEKLKFPQYSKKAEYYYYYYC
jgi:hypothetical protein